jgi:hypothetical protein
MDLSSLNHHRNPFGQLLEEILDHPFHRLFLLPSIRVEPLVEVASPMQEGHSYHWHPEISSRAKGIPR